MPRAQTSERNETRRLSEPPTQPDAAGEARDTRSTSMGSAPSDEDIRLRAYHKYLERGGSHGRDLDDWVSAERELRSGR
jgi:hypothetical protein